MGAHDPLSKRYFENRFSNQTPRRKPVMCPELSTTIPCEKRHAACSLETLLLHSVAIALGTSGRSNILVHVAREATSRADGHTSHGHLSSQRPNLANQGVPAEPAMFAEEVRSLQIRCRMNLATQGVLEERAMFAEEVRSLQIRCRMNLATQGVPAEPAMFAEEVRSLQIRYHMNLATQGVLEERAMFAEEVRSLQIRCQMNLATLGILEEQAMFDEEVRSLQNRCRMNLATQSVSSLVTSYIVLAEPAMFAEEVLSLPDLGTHTRPMHPWMLSHFAQSSHPSEDQSQTRICEG
eukprot:TRINITY_DN2212_c0_g1_i1.p1 TRINITY_DN2212_c0_g1~~TRINITY_DN2212_c0_g1_i1.p1  ORF type:complete len:294 (-),score=26.69 TRINITY_DN2212_c0_g1_i1:114-995(-)